MVWEGQVQDESAIAYCARSLKNNGDMSKWHTANWQDFHWPNMGKFKHQIMELMDHNPMKTREHESTLTQINE